MHLLVVKVPGEDGLGLGVHDPLEEHLGTLLHRTSLNLGDELGGTGRLGTDLQTVLLLLLGREVVFAVVRGVHLLVDVVVPHRLVVIHLEVMFCQMAPERNQHSSLYLE